MLQYSYRSDSPAIARDSNHLLARLCVPPPARRTPIRWPGDARVALWVCPNLLHYEYLPPRDSWVDPYSRMPAPDVLMYGRQDFGTRVGFWRMLDMLDRHDLRCTAVVNSEALRRYGAICEAAVARRWDYVGHGANNTRFTFHMDFDEEVAYYRAIADDVRALTGVRLSGMGGPGPQSATPRTLEALAAAGFDYYTDLFFDDRPVALPTRAGRLMSLPYTLELNDPPFLGVAFEADQFADAIIRQFDVLYEEGATTGQVMCISLHGYLFGQPQRTRYLDRAFSHILSHDGVWQTTGAQIAAHYLSHHHDEDLRIIEGAADV